MKHNYFAKDKKKKVFCLKCGEIIEDYDVNKASNTTFCKKHRYIFNKYIYEKGEKFNSVLKNKTFNRWKNWTFKNWDRRNKIALDSYHRRKNDPKNKKRKHRRTRFPEQTKAD